MTGFALSYVEPTHSELVARIVALEAALAAAQARHLERDAIDEQQAEATARLAAERDEARKDKDGAYLERNQCVAALSKLFSATVSRTAIEGWSEDWHGCVYIDLPTGQASWHFHDSQAHLFAHLPYGYVKWDGHDTLEKYRRLAAIDAARLPAEKG